jgi:hypothetical protein
VNAVILMLLAPALAQTVNADVIQTTLSRFNEHAVFKIPPLDPDQIEDLLTGEVVRWVDRPGDEGNRRAVGLYIANQPQDRMWLSFQDLHFQGDPSIFELRLDVNPPDDTLWYGLLSVPKPFQDRQWLVRSWNNHALSAATGGEHWEHPWRSLEGDQTDRLEYVKTRAAAGDIGPVTADDVTKAILTPANYGAYLAIQLPDGRTLFGYHAVFIAGGNIPDWAVVQFAYAGLNRALRAFEARARDEVSSHYDAAHVPVIGGDGLPVGR